MPNVWLREEERKLVKLWRELPEADRQELLEIVKQWVALALKLKKGRI